MVSEENMKIVVKQLIGFYASLKATYGEESNQVIFDDNKALYELRIVAGVFNPQLVPMIQIEIKDELIWIHHDATDEFIAYRLEQMGIPKKQIVLGFLPFEERQLTDYALGEPK